MSKFNFKQPSTWTWVELNAWTMGASENDLKTALRAEQKRPASRLAYEMRIQSRLNVIAGSAAKRKLLKRGA